MQACIKRRAGFHQAYTARKPARLGRASLPLIRAGAGDGTDKKAAKPSSDADLAKLLSHLSPEEITIALECLKREGYGSAQDFGLLQQLTNQELLDIGIADPGMRQRILINVWEMQMAEDITVFTRVGDGRLSETKLDRLGFKTRLQTEIWIKKTGKKDMRIRKWEQLEAGHVYDIELNLDSELKRIRYALFKVLELEIQACALALLLLTYPEAKVHTRPRPPEEEKNEDFDPKRYYSQDKKEDREFDVIIVTHKFVLVLEVKAKLGKRSIVQLKSGIEFIRREAAAGAKDLAFARGKEVIGGLGGLDIADKLVYEAVQQENWSLFLPNGTRFSNTNPGSIPATPGCMIIGVLVLLASVLALSAFAVLM